MSDWPTAAGLADELGVGILLVGDNERVAAANFAAQRLLGGAGLVGKSLIEAFVDHHVEFHPYGSATPAWMANEFWGFIHGMAY